MLSIKQWSIFFPQLFTWIGRIDDPRQIAKITYPLPVMVWEAILLFLLKFGSRRQLTWMLAAKNQPAIISHLSALTKQDLSHLAAIAMDDTVNDLFTRLSTEQLQHTVQEMIRSLVRQRTLEQFRLLDEYYMVAFDATGLFHRHSRHCPLCLVSKNAAGELLYSHSVLEAKLITENGLAFSIASEHIENYGEDSIDLRKEKEKQDCELKAFKRLAPRIKAAFPQLKICLLLDSLYAAQTVMDICRQYRWAYIICFKEGAIPSVAEEMQSQLSLLPENLYRRETMTTRQVIRWTSEITYHTHSLYGIHCPDHYQKSSEEKKFLYISSIKPTRSTVGSLANGAGRQRWKIENQGFNMQKNGGYNLEHVYTENDNAAKCYYLCLQIAHILNQLIEKGNLLGDVRKKFGSIKNLTAHLKDALRFIYIEPADITALLAQPFQIRFATDTS